MLRWDRTRGSHTSAVASLLYHGKELVPSFPLSWKEGSYRSEALSKALAELQEKQVTEPRDPVQLVLTLDGIAQSPVSFSIFPKEALEELLSQERALEVLRDPVAITLGRVGIYRQARLFGDAIEEYWKLHLLVPKRDDITQLVVGKLKDIGDGERLRQLR